MPVGPALLLALAALPRPDQEPAAGAEELRAALAARTEERRTAAAQAWRDLAPVWFGDGPAPAREAARAALLDRAPEVQEPALAALLRAVEADGDPARPRELLRFLGETMNSAGADRLGAAVPALPADLALPAWEAALARGGRLAEPALDRFLRRGTAAERGRALRALLAHGRADRAAERLAAVQPPEVSPADLGAGLAALAARPDLPENFVLPEDLLSRTEPEVVAGVLALLRVRPDRRAEERVAEAAAATDLAAEARRLALAVAEDGWRRFRWRRAQRTLERHLEDHPEDPLAEEVAWTLHRMDSRAGARFLTEPLEEAVRANGDDYRARFRLGSRLVELGDFDAAYREFRTGLKLVEAFGRGSRVDRSTWLDAARAACGSRHYGEGLDWLRGARMSPRQLEPYRDLPEFAGALKKSSFRKLFGLE